MNEEKKYFMECHLAGRQFYDANEVWDRLKIGTLLEMEREPENRYDPRAILLSYKDEETGKKHKLGYIPQVHNEQMSVLMDMGWNDLFECRISKLSADVHYEQQIRVTIRVRRRD